MSEANINRRKLIGALTQDHGSSAVEFVLILPLMLVLLFGTFEVGRMFWTYNIVSSSVRDAGRFAARLPMTCGGLTNGADLTRVKQLARTGVVAGGAPLIAGWTNDANVAVTVDCDIDNSTGDFAGVYEDMAAVPRVTVSATAPYSPLFSNLLPIDLSSITVNHQEVWTE